METNIMYKNKQLLEEWTEHLIDVQELTRHNGKYTTRKTTLNQILTAGIHDGQVIKLLGVKLKKVGDQKYVIAPRSKPTTPITALLRSFDSARVTLPEFIKRFYPEIGQRDDYEPAIQIADKNLSRLTLQKLRYASWSVKHLMYSQGKDDPWLTDKRIMLDVTKALYKMMINQVTGRQLTKEAGRGLYITVPAIKACMSSPTVASNNKISNALLSLRVAGLLHLSQPSELTKAGSKLNRLSNPNGSIELHRIYTISDFSSADFEGLSNAINFNLACRPSRSQLIQLFDDDAQVVHDYFPDLAGGGVGPEEIKLGRIWHDLRGDTNRPIMTARAAACSLEGLSNIKPSTSVKYLDQLLLDNALEMSKLTSTEAEENGYNLDDYPLRTNQKLIVSTSREALMMCIQRLKRSNKKGKRVSQLLH